MPKSSEKNAKKITAGKQLVLANSVNKDSITQNTKKTNKHTRKNKHLTIKSRTLTLALKFYPEQLLTDVERASITNSKTGRIDYNLWENGDLLKLTKARLKEQIENFSEIYNRLKSSKDKKKRHWQVAGICHDRDKVANPDDLFEPSSIKPHFHVLVRDANNNRFFVELILKVLGLNYQKQDSTLFYEHGCTTISDFNAYFVYLFHETKQAVLDGKEHYELSELLTNMSKDEIRDIKQGYSRLQNKTKLTDEDWNKLAKYASELGDKKQNFDKKFKNILTFAQRGNHNFDRLRAVYNKHLHHAIDTTPARIRCCILIYGNPGDGKSYNALEALKSLGKKTYYARENTGKYDELEYDTQAMLFDDRKIGDPLKVTDNTACIVHGRGTGNDKAWLGNYVIATTNRNPEEFFKTQLPRGSSKQIEALRGRFYICFVECDKKGNRRLVIKDRGSTSTRGLAEDILERNKLYIQFADSFDKSIAHYHPPKGKDIPQLDDKYFADND